MGCKEAKIYYIYCDYKDCSADCFIPSVEDTVPLPVGWKAQDVPSPNHSKIAGIDMVTRYYCPNHSYKLHIK